MKSGLCKYYQPLRLEKPSNFRLEQELQDAEDELKQARPEAVVAAAQPIQAAPCLLVSLVGGLAIPLDRLFAIFGNAEALLISPAEVVLGIGIVVVGGLSEPVDGLAVILRQAVAAMGVEQPEVHLRPAGTLLGRRRVPFLGLL